MCVLGLSEPVGSVLTFPCRYDTLKYSWVKTTAVSVRLWILFVMLQNTNNHKGILWFEDRLVIPKSHELQKQILDEAHLSKFSIHPGSTKMYQDLRQNFWWTRMKREIAKYVAECDTCQRVKAYHLRVAGTLQPLLIPS